MTQAGGGGEQSSLGGGLGTVGVSGWEGDGDAGVVGTGGGGEHSSMSGGIAGVGGTGMTGG